MKAEPRARLEVHSHSYVSGGARPFDHAHVDGDTGHQHPETGPACFTIDKDAWLRATGLRGGGRKAFSAKPRGLQLERVELADWQKSFRVVLSASAEPEAREDGPGGAAVARMALTFGMEPKYA